MDQITVIKIMIHSINNSLLKTNMEVVDVAGDGNARDQARFQTLVQRTMPKRNHIFLYEKGKIPVD